MLWQIDFFNPMFIEYIYLGITASGGWCKTTGLHSVALQGKHWNRKRDRIYYGAQQVLGLKNRVGVGGASCLLISKWGSSLRAVSMYKKGVPIQCWWWQRFVTVGHGGKSHLYEPKIKRNNTDRLESSKI